MLRLASLTRPQYLYRPRQILRRIWQEVHPGAPRRVISLPWHLPLEIDLSDSIGRALASQGIYDLVTTEVLWRLTQRGDRTFDIGANIGYMSSLLAYRTGDAGGVDAFEPHPRTCELLRSNAASWSGRRKCASVRVHELALSCTDGTGSLELVPGVEGNIGEAFLSAAAAGTSLSVKLARLEPFLAAVPSVGVMKIDAQWHEAQVLTGAGMQLQSGKIRDIVFEEEGGYPSKSHRILEVAGYAVFWFEERWQGPRMIPPDQHPAKRSPYDIAPSFLATLDPSRAKKLFSAGGWQCL
jgi:FkbM family methyltransferase